MYICGHAYKIKCLGQEKKKKNGEWFHLIKKILFKGHYRERTGTAVGHHVRENESGKGGTTTCGSMLCFPDTPLKSGGERLSVVSPSLTVLLPRTLSEHKKPQGHRKMCFAQFLVWGVPWASRVCHHSLLLGFEVAQALVYVFFLRSHMPHRSGFPTQEWWTSHSSVKGVRL